MTYEVDPKIEALEKRILTEPDSVSLYDRLLWMYFDQESLHGHPNRINHILVCIRRFPRKKICRTPFVHIDPKISPDGFKTVENEWLKLLSENPDDAKVALGTANFYCTKDLKRSIEILRNIVDQNPSQAEVWLDLGRYTTDPKERLNYFQEAQRQGAIQPNLLVWIAISAVEAGEYKTAEAYAENLLELVDTARTEYGDMLDWKEKGRSLFAKALEATGDRSAASNLTSAISAHAYHKHWGHTVLGHIALQQEDLGTALKHLRESGSVVGDHRLSSYGPSMSLAKEICIRGEWSNVADYLRACETFYKDERLPIWISMIESKKIFPDL